MFPPRPRIFPAPVTRYVITHIGKDGMRPLADACQGRYTYETEGQANTALAQRIEANGSRLVEFYGLPLAVRAVQCWPGHFDPVGIYFDD